MGLFSNWFGTSGAETLERLESRVAELHRSGRSVEAVRATEQFRYAADKDRRITEDERLYQFGAACVLAMEPLLAMARERSGRERYDALKAFFAMYRSMHETLGRLEAVSRQHKPADVERFMSIGRALYDVPYAEFDGDDVEGADLEANEAIRKGFGR